MGKLLLACNPDQLAFATLLTSRQPPRPEMVLVVKASWSIGEGGVLEPLAVKEAPVTGDVFDPAEVDYLGEVIEPSDLAHQKLRPEVIVRATCHPPRGRAVRECMVGVRVGSWSKQLRVVGTRVWAGDALGGAASEALPFTSMPITWANAFGGPEVEANPIGKGVIGSELPNIERPDSPIKRMGGSHVAAGFGPINTRWPVRAKKLGKDYGERWKSTRAPFVSEDFDWTYHQSAPPDQWLETLRGDERLVFENLYPRTSELVVELPRVRILAFGRREGKAVTPIPMTLDTLFADLEKNRISLVWRGHMRVTQHDLTDVKSIIFAKEPLGQATRTAAQYERELEAFEADPAGLSAVKQEIEARARALEGELPPPAATSATTDAVDPVSAKLGQFFSEDSLVRRHVKAMMDEALAGPSGAALKTALANPPSEDDSEPIPRGRPGVAPSIGLRRKMRPVAERISLLRSVSDLPSNLRQRVEDAEERLRSPQFAKADPEYTYPLPLSTDLPGPQANLVDRDLTGQDLRGIDLRGAKLDGAVLTRANLSGVDLRGASLRGTLLFKTDLSNANLSDCDLVRANFGAAHAPQARFDRSTIDEAFFQRANLAGASLTKVRGLWPVFERANLVGADLSEAVLERADFGEADLSDARVRRATLQGALLERAKAHRADFSESDLSRTCARSADLAFARFVRARAPRSSFDEADLSNADLSLAFMRGTHLSEAKLDTAEVYGADLREARLYRADLSRALFDRSNLMHADLVYAKVEGTRFRNANLFEAELLNAAGEGADFSGANLEGCAYTKTRPSEMDA
ncbi:MAG: DUF2169 domain-containing protein [Polyangiaceae bacterium]